MFKKAKVVMLATNEKAIGDIRMSLITNKLLYKDSKATLCNIQHLYITSDEEIKEGDWFIDSTDNTLWQNKASVMSKVLFPECIKIIASTDLSLKQTMFTYPDKLNPYNVNNTIKSIPQPSPSFITKYIEEYNKGNVITEIMIEYEVNYRKDCDIIPEQCINYMLNVIDCEGCSKAFYKLKVNSKDDTITIKKIKDSWNKKELKPILLKICQDLDDSIKKETDNDFKVEVWIEQNL